MIHRPTAKAPRSHPGRPRRRFHVLRSLAAWALPGCLAPTAADLSASHGHVKGHGALHHVLHDLPVLLALVAAAGLLHHWGVTESFTAQAMRITHRAESATWLAPDWAAHAFERESLPDAPSDEPVVTVLRINADFFARDFCGITPVSRARLVPLIDRLTERLRIKSPPGKPDRPVVAIDLDVTEQSGEGLMAAHAACAGTAAAVTAKTASGGDEALRSALAALAKRAAVIAVAMPRGTDPARRQRDASVRTLCAAGVRFATAETYVDPGEPFYRFLHHRRAPPHGVHAPDPAASLPAVYPALGTLAGLALVHGSCPPGAAEAPRHGDDHDPCRALAAICDGANAVGAPLLAIDIDSAARKALLAAYGWSYFDFLRGVAHVRVAELGSVVELGIAVDGVLSKWSSDRGRMPAPIFLLSIDDGYTDRHFTVVDQSDATVGDSIQAAMALSHIDPLCSPGPVWDAALDIALGTVYLLLWVGCLRGIDHLEHKRLPWLGKLVLGLAPLVLFAALGATAVRVSASALAERHWLDPLPVLAGLTLHAYLSVYSRAIDAAAGSHGTARPFDRRMACAVGSALRWLPIALWLALVPGHPDECRRDRPTAPHDTTANTP